MHERMLGNVREQLLRAGVAPRHVNRYVMELREHFTDLVARETATGLDTHAAATKARALLGEDAQLVNAMLERGPPRSITAKAPWAVLGILPLLLLVILTALLAICSVAFFAPYAQLPATAATQSVRVMGALITFVGSYGIGLALAAACIVIAVRQRVASPWIWVGLALIAVASGPLGIHIDIPPPDSGVSGAIRGSILQTVHAAGRIDINASLLVMGSRTLALFAVSALALRMLQRRVVANAT